MFTLTSAVARSLTFSFSLIALALAGGCARDRDTRDFKKDELKKDLAQLQVVEGIYSGQLFSNKTNASLGNFGIELKADTKVTNLSEQAPVLRGTVIFAGNSLVKFVFADSYYDTENKTFKSTFKSSGLDAEELRLEGRIDGDKLTGTLEIPGYSETGTHFETERQVTLSSVEEGFSGSSTVTTPVENYDKNYISGAVAVAGSPDFLFKIRVWNADIEKEDRFLNLLSRTQRTKVALSYKYYRDRNNGARPVDNTTSDANIDLTTGIIRAKFTTVNLGGSAGLVQTSLLECKPIAASKTDLVCNYTGSSGTQTTTFNVTPNNGGAQ